MGPYLGVENFMRLYHNPRCSKSREAVKILQELNIEFEIHEYIKNGIHPDDIDNLSRLPGIIRINEGLYKENEIDIEDYSAIKNLLFTHPKLLQRPILVDQNRCVIGRPVENILTLLP